MSLDGTKRHVAPPRDLGRKWGTADIAMVAHVNR
jgi:hypothetical protein